MSCSSHSSYHKEMGEPARPRFQRIGGSKTRNGCVTCKARRVKCDERKPLCARCEKAGRRCEGYQAPNPSNHQVQLKIVRYVPTSHTFQSAQPDVFAPEQRALAYFQHRTVPELAGSFSRELWSQFILLVAHHQASVRHALVALGSMHEDFVNAEASTRQPASDYARKHYGKAIHEVRTINAKTKDGVEVALITCIIFACLESLQGHYQSAVTHITSGMKMLEEEQTADLSESHAYIPRAVLRLLFVRLDTQIMNIGATPLGSGISLARNVQVSIPKCFSSIDEASNQFEIIQNRAIHLLTEGEKVVADPDSPPHVLGMLHQDLARMESDRAKWEEAFNAMLRNDRGGILPRDPPCLLLNIYNNLFKVMFRVNIVDPDSDFDRFVHVFRIVIDDAEEYLFKTSKFTPSSSATSSQPTTPSPGFFSLDGDISFVYYHQSPISHHPSSISQPLNATPTQPPLAPRAPSRITRVFNLSLSVVAALYISAARCRSAPIRHKALSLLKTCNRREGLWDSNIAACIAERVINIEEAKLRAEQQQQEHDYLSVSESEMTYTQIPDHLRVKTVDVSFGPDDSLKADYSFRDAVHAYAEREYGIPTFNELMRW